MDTLGVQELTEATFLQAVSKGEVDRFVVCGFVRNVMDSAG